FFDKVNLVQSLAERALRGQEEFAVRPVLPLYLPGEPIELQVDWHPATPAAAPALKITSYPESQTENRATTTVALHSNEPILLPSPAGKGLYIIEAQLLDGDRVRAIYHAGFWIRDQDFLR